MGPLDGVRVIELQGIGPGPYCGMMLADMGAEIVRIDRSANVGGSGGRVDILARGRRSIGVDLKNPEGVETVLKLVEQADVLIQGFRPGVTERLGLGPDVCLARNPRLAVMAGGVDRLGGERRERIFTAAEGFLRRCTVAPAA